ncbi:MAG: radical SAM protein, partial [Planctomycetota bacterium]
MSPRVLLVNPPIYDFAAYDFWLKPYGLLSVAGQLRGRADFVLFDYLDRLHPHLAGRADLRPDRWGRRRFHASRIDRPPCLKHIPRYFRRFGLPRDLFRAFLTDSGPFDTVLIQTVMTYWYPGVAEVIEDVRDAWPQARIVLGGNYVAICPNHAARLGADLLVGGADLDPLWNLLEMRPDPGQPALWETYDRLNVGVLKLTEGCPFKCTYCSVPKVYGAFQPRSLERSLAELDLLIARGVEDIAFYDDALLFDVEAVLLPFLEEVIRRGLTANFHTPNALNA